MSTVNDNNETTRGYELDCLWYNSCCDPDFERDILRPDFLPSLRLHRSVYSKLDGHSPRVSELQASERSASGCLVTDLTAWYL